MFHLEARQVLKGLSDQELEEFLQASKRIRKWTGIGVALILVGLASLVFINCRFFSVIGLLFAAFLGMRDALKDK